MHAAPGPDADEDRRGALLHQRERGLGVGRVADRDRDRHEPGELVERERVVAGREMAGARDLALDEEQVGAVLGAERPEPARGAGRRGHRGLRAGGVDLVDPARDRGPRGSAAGRPRRGRPGPRRRARSAIRARISCRVVVARLDALEVEDRQAAEPGQRAGERRVDDRVHRRGEDRDRELDAAEGLGELDVGRLDRVRARARARRPRSRRSGGSVDLRAEDAALGRGRDLRVRRRCASLDHVALLCRLTVGLLLSRSLPRQHGRSPRRPVATEREFEPGRPFGVGDVVADPLDRGPIARPDALGVGHLAGLPDSHRADPRRHLRPGPGALVRTHARWRPVSAVTDVLPR